MNRLTIEQEDEALRQAARSVGLDSHITYMNKKSEAYTSAERLMLLHYRKGMPYKKSFLMCDTLDACFYFDPDGKACVTVTARWRNGAKDLGKPINDALAYIRKMLDAMDAEASKWLQGGMDERH